LDLSNKIIQRPNKEITSHILRNTILLVGNSIVFACILQIILTVSPLVIIESTNSITLGSLTTAVVLSCDIPTNYHAGKLADAIGRKKTLLIGILIGLVGLFTMTLSRLLREDNFYWLGLVIFGLSTGFFVLNRAAIMDMYPQNRGKSLGYLNTGSFIGSLFGPILISGITALAIRFGKNYYDLLIFTCLPLLAFAGFLIFLIGIDTKIIAQSLENCRLPSEVNLNSLKEERWTSVLQDKRDLLLLFIISSLSVAGVSIVYSLCPIFLNILEIEVGWIGFAVALVGLGTGGVSIFLGKLSDKFGRKKPFLQVH
jgi:MFS family permease